MVGKAQAKGTERRVCFLQKRARRIEPIVDFSKVVEVLSEEGWVLGVGCFLHLLLFCGEVMDDLLLGIVQGELTLGKG